MRVGTKIMLTNSETLGHKSCMDSPPWKTLWALVACTVDSTWILETRRVPGLQIIQIGVGAKVLQCHRMQQAAQMHQLPVVGLGTEPF